MKWRTTSMNRQQTMTVPLMILALLSAIGGWFALPVLWGEENILGRFLEPVLRGVVTETTPVELGKHTLVKEYLLMMTSVGVALAGIWLAYNFFIKKPQVHEQIVARFPRLYSLLSHKYYMDEIYDALFVNRIKDLSLALGLLDAKIIDGVAINGTAALTRFFSSVSMLWDKWIIDGLVNLVGKFTRSLSHPIRMIQTGLFSSYALWILLGVAVLLAYYGHHMQLWVRTLYGKG